MSTTPEDIPLVSGYIDHIFPGEARAITKDPGISQALTEAESAYELLVVAVGQQPHPVGNIHILAVMAAAKIQSLTKEIQLANRMFEYANERNATVDMVRAVADHSSSAQLGPAATVGSEQTDHGHLSLGMHPDIIAIAAERLQSHYLANGKQRSIDWLQGKIIDSLEIEAALEYAAEHDPDFREV